MPKDGLAGAKEGKNPFSNELHNSTIKIKARNTSEEEDEPVVKLNCSIDSIDPVLGPVRGGTRVTVRGGPFAKFKEIHPNPFCKFGDKISSASYTHCTKAQPRAWEFEGDHSKRTETCIECEASPPYPDQTVNANVTFTITLDGSWKDVNDSDIFTYHKPMEIHSIKPVGGPKDGGSIVQVWGENFLEKGDDAICAFGVKASAANIINDHYLTCVSAGSNIVGRAMPFSVSLNG